MKVRTAVLSSYVRLHSIIPSYITHRFHSHIFPAMFLAFEFIKLALQHIKNHLLFLRFACHPYPFPICCSLSWKLTPFHSKKSNTPNSFTSSVLSYINHSTLVLHNIHSHASDNITTPYAYTYLLSNKLHYIIFLSLSSSTNVTTIVFTNSFPNITLHHLFLHPSSAYTHLMPIILKLCASSFLGVDHSIKNI